MFYGGRNIMVKPKGSGGYKTYDFSLGKTSCSVYSNKELMDFVDNIICGKLHLYPSRSAFVRAAIRDKVDKEIERIQSMLGIIRYTNDESKPMHNMLKDSIIVPKLDPNFDYYKIVKNKNHANREYELK